jgi:hypothetical protein
MYYTPPTKDLLKSQTMALIACRKPPRYVPYKGTYVPYDGTYGASDQGQMLDARGSQTAKSALT